jgi:ubiquinone/menaquinone biosynthesis C-methylase UbiE
LTEIFVPKSLPPYLLILTYFYCIGLFLEGLSATVGPNGRVYVTEVSEPLISYLNQRVGASSLANVIVQPVVADTSRLDLVPEGSVDLVLICDVYHHLEYPKTAMRGTIRCKYIFI